MSSPENKKEFIDELSEGKGCVFSIVVIIIFFIILGWWLFF